MIRIHAPAPSEFDQFLPLWRDYLRFYQHDLPDEVTAQTWARFMDTAEPMHIWAAIEDERWLGFATYVVHRSTWARTGYCYLEDLYVGEADRDRGAARLLIEAVADAARMAGWERLYWVTDKGNDRARSLYDRLARPMDFIQYQKPL